MNVNEYIQTKVPQYLETLFIIQFLHYSNQSSLEIFFNYDELEMILICVARDYERQYRRIQKEIFSYEY